MFSIVYLSLVFTRVLGCPWSGCNKYPLSDPISDVEKVVFSDVIILIDAERLIRRQNRRWHYW